MKTILLVEDDPIMGESLLQRFELEGFNVRWCHTLDQARQAIDEDPLAVVSDIRLPDGLASDWYVNLPARVRGIPWFFLTGYGSVNDAVRAVQAGARQYLTKPFDIEALVASVLVATSGCRSSEDDVVMGISMAMRQVESMLQKVGPQRVSLLLTGESGVGKEVAAQLVHRSGTRGDAPFVAVNCAAIPETLMEAEFFGYEKHAFTGAHRAHRGYLERAHGGTLFLDEVADLPASMQAKLLRALQERSFFRLGSESVMRSDFRVVAATNRDLREAMQQGAFREDLYYRLAVVRVHLPPLRERPEDIRWLAEQMLLQIAEEQGGPVAASEAFMRSLMAQRWSGNARELRAHLEQAVALSEAGILDVLDGEPELAVGHDRDGNLAPLHEVLTRAEATHIRRALTTSNGSIGKAAELLGISRKTLWEKMKRGMIEAPQQRANQT